MNNLISKIKSSTVLKIVLPIVAGVIVIGAVVGIVVCTKPKDTTISLQNSNKIYDGQQATLSFKTNSGASVSLEWYTKDGVKLEESPIYVGEYKVVAKTPEVKRYREQTKEFDFAIVQRDVELTWEYTFPAVYTGSPIATKLSVGGIVEGDVCTVDTELHGDNVNATAEGFYLTAVSVSNPNYKLPEEPSSSVTIIARNPGSIDDIPSLNKTYDGQPVEFTIPAHNGDGAVTVEWKKGDTVLTSAPTECGEYTVVVKVAQTQNYSEVSIEKECHIEKRAIVVVLEDLVADTCVPSTSPAKEVPYTINNAISTDNLSVSISYTGNRHFHSEEGFTATVEQIVAENESVLNNYTWTELPTRHYSIDAHDFDTTLMIYDDDTHCQECVGCGYEGNIEAHNWTYELENEDFHYIRCECGYIDEQFHEYANHVRCHLCGYDNPALIDISSFTDFNVNYTSSAFTLADYSKQVYVFKFEVPNNSFGGLLGFRLQTIQETTAILKPNQYTFKAYDEDMEEVSVGKLGSHVSTVNQVVPFKVYYISIELKEAPDSLTNSPCQIKIETMFSDSSSQLKDANMNDFNGNNVGIVRITENTTTTHRKLISNVPAGQYYIENDLGDGTYGCPENINGSFFVKQLTNNAIVDCELVPFGNGYILTTETGGIYQLTIRKTEYPNEHVTKVIPMKDANSLGVIEFGDDSYKFLKVTLESIGGDFIYRLNFSIDRDSAYNDALSFIVYDQDGVVVTPDGNDYDLEASKQYYIYLQKENTLPESFTYALYPEIGTEVSSLDFTLYCEPYEYVISYRVGGGKTIELDLNWDHSEDITVKAYNVYGELLEDISSSHSYTNTSTIRQRIIFVLSCVSDLDDGTVSWTIAS